jgi:L-serine/L-threonine ammonia-lyase
MFHIESPLLKSSPLSAHVERDIWLKLEAVQPTGSFKIRGIGYACQQLVHQGARRIISSSGGNAGIAAAYAGRQLSVPVLVVVPESTSARAKTLISQEGAQVMVYGESWQEANNKALALVAEDDAFIHPFDHALIWRGHSTMIDELARSAVKPDLIILSVGGGGLLCGVIEGLQRNGWSDIPLIAVETEGADALAQSIEAGYRVELPAITSLATSLGARQVCEQAYHWSKTYPIYSVVVSDQAAVAACHNFLADHRILVEPACGASLAVVYHNAALLQTVNSILVIVCGGVTTTVEQLQQWHEHFA